MSGSAGSPATAAAWQQRQQSFQALKQALSSNQLDAAKTAYASLTGNGSGNTSSIPNGLLAQIGKALAGGDVSAAQQALSTMRSAHQPSSATQALSTPTASIGNNVDVFV
jgi:hypothetical protein